MKKKYAGLSKTFYIGYNELNADDFFCTNGENLDEMSLIDRINLYFKIGAFHNIQFNDVEEEFLTRISLAETFQDVLEISQDLVDYVKEKKKEEIESMPELGDQQSGSGNQQQGDNNQSEEGVGENEEPNDDNENAEDKSGQSQSTPTQSNASGGAKPDEVGGRDSVNELESKTSRSFDEKSKQLNEKKYTDDYTAYVELPEFDLSKLVLPNEYVHRLARRYYEQTIHNSYYDSQIIHYNEFKKSAEREVSYLVKEFECRKAADSYARASTARTGVLDTARLHTYKYNEDLFKKVSVIPDGKNHGLIFILDSI
jgi:cobalamin biosynthesis protein CobT